jgi:hypothetical protein
MLRQAFMNPNFYKKLLTKGRMLARHIKYTPNKSAPLPE